MAQAHRLGGWMTRFKRCIDAEAGAAVSEKVIIETERFDATSDYAQKAETKTGQKYSATSKK